MQDFLIPALLGYLIGSIPFSYLVGRMTAHLDLREYGSGNIGATNVIRVSGKKAGAAAFILDLTKGIASYSVGLALSGIPGAAIAAGFAILGHSYSIFMKFHGGKGVATTFGVLFMFNPFMALFMFVFQVIVVKVTHYMSFGSILSALLAPIFAWLLHLEMPLIYLGIFIAVFVTFRHKSNISRLLKGTENRFDV
jgi:glycerol-3-phosphate acyltransferase PlsY